jgi:hypothetical protein
MGCVIVGHTRKEALSGSVFWPYCCVMVGTSVGLHTEH